MDAGQKELKICYFEYLQDKCLEKTYMLANKNYFIVEKTKVAGCVWT